MSKQINIPKEYYNTNDSDNACFLCGKPDYELVYDIKTFKIPLTFKKCQCGLEKQTPMPNNKFFEWFYDSDIFFSAKKAGESKIWGFYDYFEDEPSRLATSKRRYKKLRHIFEAKHPLEIMKVGPSTGTFLYVAQQHGHHVLGCDISSQFVDYAKRKYGIKVDNGRFEHMNYADGQFDVIMLFNVLENIPNQVEFFSAVHRMLKPDGHFIFNFVDMKRNLIARLQKSKYFLYRPPICYIYTFPLIEKVINKFGFEIVRSMSDIRYLHIEKIITLLGWNWLLFVVRFLKINRLHFPIYAYPSKIVIASREALPKHKSMT